MYFAFPSFSRTFEDAGDQLTLKEKARTKMLQKQAEQARLMRMSKRWPEKFPFSFFLTFFLSFVRSSLVGRRLCTLGDFFFEQKEGRKTRVMIVVLGVGRQRRNFMLVKGRFLLFALYRQARRRLRPSYSLSPSMSNCRRRS